MTLFRTEDPAAEPVTVAEAKAYLRVSHDSEDELLGGLIRAAREEVERSTGLALMRQSWRLVRDDWPKENVGLLQRRPVREILAITIYDSDGGGSVLAPETYQLDAVSSPARLYLSERPAPGLALNGIEIDFSAGYGDAGTEVPDLLKRVMLILVAHWYEFRGACGAEGQPVSIPDEYRRLIASYRNVRL